jgi:hypothetical protein
MSVERRHPFGAIGAMVLALTGCYMHVPTGPEVGVSNRPYTAMPATLTLPTRVPMAGRCARATPGQAEEVRALTTAIEAAAITMSERPTASDQWTLAQEARALWNLVSDCQDAAADADELRQLVDELRSVEPSAMADMRARLQSLALRIRLQMIA